MSATHSITPEKASTSFDTLIESSTSSNSRVPWKFSNIKLEALPLNVGYITSTEEYQVTSVSQAVALAEQIQKISRNSPLLIEVTGAVRSHPQGETGFEKEYIVKAKNNPLIEQTEGAERLFLKCFPKVANDDLRLTLTSLPVDILARCFSFSMDLSDLSFLAIRDHESVMTTSHTIHGAISSSPFGGNENEESEAAVQKARSRGFSRVPGTTVPFFLSNKVDLKKVTTLNLRGITYLSALELRATIQKYPNLTFLAINGGKITDDHLRELPGLPHLKVLHINYDMHSRCPVSNTGLAFLKPLQSLHTLDISGCQYIDNDGLSHLQSLRSLTTLKLPEQISGGALPHLLRIPSLREIDLTKCR